jgi:hypothetical protein
MDGRSHGTIRAGTVQTRKQIWARMVGIPAEIRIWNLPNAIRKRFAWANFFALLKSL